MKKINNKLIGIAVLAFIAFFSAIMFVAETVSAAVSGDLSVDGASVRITDNINDSGIRFSVSVGSEKYEALPAGSAVGVAVIYEQYDVNTPLFNGNIINDEKYFWDKDDVQTAEHLKIWMFDNINLTKNGDVYVGHVAIVNIVEFLEERVAYVFIKDSAGNYTDVAKGSARSMTYVAQCAIEDRNEAGLVYPEGSYERNFLIQNYIENKGESAYKIKHIKCDNSGQEISVEITESKGIVGQYTSDISYQNYSGYEFDDGNANNVLSSVIYANGRTELTCYYRPIKYEITGQIKNNYADNKLDVIATDNTTSREYVLTSDATGVVAGSLPIGEYTVRVKGYTDSATVTVTEQSNQNNFTLSLNNFEFGETNINSDTVQSASYTASGNELIGWKGSNWAQEPAVDAGTDWFRGTINGTDYVQGNGKPYALYYENFAETEYAVGAFVSYGYSLLDNSTTNLGDGARNAGIAISSGTETLHILAYADGLKLSFGDCDENGKNNDTITVNAGSGFVNNLGAMFERRRGVYMYAVRENNVLTVSLDGVKYLTADLNGLQLFDAFANASVTYSGDMSETLACEKFAVILGQDVKNKVGYTATVGTSGRAYNYSVFTQFHRSADVNYFNGQLFLPLKVEVNESTLTNGDSANRKLFVGNKELGYNGNNWGWNFVQKEQSVYAKLAGVGTNSAVFFNKTAIKDFSYSATFDISNSNGNNDRIGLAITNGETRLIFSLISNQRLMIASDYNGQNKGVGFQKTLSDTIIKYFTLKIETNIANGEINVYFAPSANATSLELVATLSAEKVFDVKNNYTETVPDTSVLKGSAQSIMESLSAGKQVAVGFGVCGVSNEQNAVISGFNFNS